MTARALRLLLLTCGTIGCSGSPRPAPPAPVTAPGRSVEAQILQVKDFLRRYGYLGNVHNHPYLVASGDPKVKEPEPQSSTSVELDEPTRNALRACQQFLGMEPTGDINEHTMSVISRTRCGVPDVFEFTIDGRRWEKSDLTYALIEDSRQINRDDVLRYLSEAFTQWAAAANLTFTEIDDPDSADIIVRFSILEHGDGVPFDGPGGTLAHAFFPPPNGGSLAGDAHFDDEEPWSIDTPAPAGRIDLASVILHEIGHSLGLGHSAVQDAVMYPFYAGERRQLHPDDIQGIQALYLTE